ncbi:hypothetical protein ACQKP0_25580 [Heyndrickxia sp. NPDC080065]|uniref:hypothetical protein n=1 Tax=Heyndrickxia sp. NPDC080065 TaxID=3390568 RepID=UPI003D07199C
MIEIRFDHSHVNNYFIDTITVNLDDKEEKERIEILAKRLEGCLVDYPNKELAEK